MYVKKIGSLGKVKLRFAEINKPCTYSTQVLIELCGIRDGTIQCNILNQKEVCALIDVLRLMMIFV